MTIRLTHTKADRTSPTTKGELHQPLPERTPHPNQRRRQEVRHESVSFSQPNTLTAFSLNATTHYAPNLWSDMGFIIYRITGPVRRSILAPGQQLAATYATHRI